MGTGHPRMGTGHPAVESGEPAVRRGQCEPGKGEPRRATGQGTSGLGESGLVGGRQGFVRGGTGEQAVAGDEACASLVREVLVRPVEEDGKPVAERDEEHNVDPQPQRPGEKAAQVEATDLCDGGSSPDGGHAAFVEIGKRRAGVVFEFRDDVLRDVAALLHGNGACAGQGFAVSVEARGHVADGENLGVVADREIGVYGHPA